MENLLTISEITVQYRPKKATRPKITTSYEAMTIARQFFPADTIELQERFVVMYLNRANRVIGIYPVSVGGITGTVADIRLVLAVALKCAATSIIMAHNHPSGKLTPSRTDMELTRRIKEAASYMDVKVIDHLILSPETGDYYSFGDEDCI
ncbi:MAG: JAB domain-containing protein [Chitinophagaceae bacterium]|nr:JAB domain-containing protein [Chitinophagaceae bacterium]